MRCLFSLNASQQVGIFRRSKRAPADGIRHIAIVQHMIVRSVLTWLLPVAILLPLLHAIQERELQPGLHIIPCASPALKVSSGKSSSKCSEPPVCARYLADSFLTPQESSALLSLSSNVMSLTSVAGGAAIFDVISGALSHGTAFINGFALLKQHNSELDTAHIISYLTVVDRIRTLIHYTLNLTTTMSLHIDDVYLTKPSFFSRLTNGSAATVNDEYWHAHIDREQYGSFIFTALVYLSDYQHNFTGGQFVFRDTQSIRQHIDVNDAQQQHDDNDDDAIDWMVEPAVGRVMFFTSGTENVHYVRRVTSGQRHALTIAFTCHTKDAVGNVLHKRFAADVSSYLRAHDLTESLYLIDGANAIAGDQQHTQPPTSGTEQHPAQSSKSKKKKKTKKTKNKKQSDTTAS